MIHQSNLFLRIRNMNLIGRIAMCLACGSLPPLSAAEIDGTKKDLAQTLSPLIEAHQGNVAVAVKHLKSGEGYEYNADQPMPTASLIKLPIMIAAYDAVARGKLSLDDLIELKREDQVPGSGILTSHFSPGAKLSLRDAIHLMIVFSDNTATNLVIDQLGLPATTELMATLGFPETRLNSKVFRRDTSLDKQRSNEFGLGSTTAQDMLQLCAALYAKTLVSEPASQQMLDHLFACDDKAKVPRLLPAVTRVAHKTGSVSSSRTDAGIIESPAGPIAFCILTDKNKDQRWTDDNAGDLLCAKFGAAIYQYFNPQGTAPASPLAGTLQMGATGDLVIALQRTLNARIKPPVQIGTDGDFGPETEGAVKQFQKQARLEPSGIVDGETWKALGPLIMDEAPTPEPAIVNSDDANKLPPDSLSGPPFVTCKAWAILDRDSGELLAGDHHDEQRDPASTTKIMTAYLVGLLAQQEPKVLDEVVTFSQRADSTPGTSAELKVGEQVPVGELLYGLMLPSGNDAAVAFAEHFGPRLANDQDNAAKLDAHDCFIAAMNRKAAELKMTATHFNNPHGLPSAGHQTTAHDLGRLAVAALQLSVFRNVVKTAQHGATLGSAAGYRRNIVWRNTNQLLRTEGYDGIKTGTTNAAGCCLVSTAQRGGRQIVIVVLGAPSTEGRYVDSRNLYRWAWKDLLKIEPAGANGSKSVSQAK